MSTLPPCPQCHSPYSYQDGILLICPECAHEWSDKAAENLSDDTLMVKDAHGNLLKDGDTINADFKRKNY